MPRVVDAQELDGGSARRFPRNWSAWQHSGPHGSRRAALPRSSPWGTMTSSWGARLRASRRMKAPLW